MAQRRRRLVLRYESWLLTQPIGKGSRSGPLADAKLEFGSKQARSQASSAHMGHGDDGV